MNTHNATCIKARTIAYIHSHKYGMQMHNIKRQKFSYVEKDLYNFLQSY